MAAHLYIREEQKVADVPSEQIRSKLASVLLALEIMGRRNRPWEQQRRIAALGFTSARTLADMLLETDPGPGPEERVT